MDDESDELMEEDEVTGIGRSGSEMKRFVPGCRTERRS